MKKVQIVLSCCLLAVSCARAATTWPETFDKYVSVMTEDEKTMFPKICKDFAAGIVPTIAAPEIKLIPISENNDPLVDVRLSAVERLEMLPNPAKPFESPLCNSGFADASKMRATVVFCLDMMTMWLDELAKPFGYTSGQITIKVFEGLRDIKVQEELFARKVQQLQTAQPTLSDEDAEKEAAKWISPVKDNIPAHSTGGAVDFLLWDTASGKPIDMGILGTLWEENPAQETFSENASTAQKANRLYCLLAAHRVGLTNYFYEFWHYSVGDRYAAYWKKQPFAVFGAITAETK